MWWDFLISFPENKISNCSLITIFLAWGRSGYLKWNISFWSCKIAWKVVLWKIRSSCRRMVEVQLIEILKRWSNLLPRARETVLEPCDFSEMLTWFDSSIVINQNYFMQCREFSIMADCNDKHNNKFSPTLRKLF